MKSVLKKKEKLSFFTICKPSGEQILVKNINQVSLALETSYANVFSKMQKLEKDKFVVIKKCIVKRLELNISRFKKGEEDE